MTQTIVGSGQTVTGVIVGGGDSLVVENGGTLVAATVQAGGSISVAGGAAVNTSVVGSGTDVAQMSVGSGGTVSGTTLLADAGAYATLTLLAGAAASDTVVGDGGPGSAVLTVQAGAADTGTLISGKGAEHITLGPGQTLGVPVILAPVDVSVLAGGTVDPGTEVNGTLTGAGFTGLVINGGLVQATPDGSIRGTTVDSGSLRLASGDTASATALNGGTLTVVPGSFAVDTTIRSGVVTVLGGRAVGSVIGTGGTLTVGAGGDAENSVVNNGGTIQLANDGTLAGTLLNGGGVVDLTDLAYDPSVAISLNGARDFLTVGNATTSTTFQLAGNYHGYAFAAAADAAGGTAVTATAPTGAVRLSGAAADYVIADDEGFLYIQDTVGGRDGTQVLPGIDTMLFSDGIGVFDPTGTAEDIARLYPALLGRAADAAGLAYWAGQVDAASLPLSAVAAGFASSMEFLQSYGTLSDAGFVDLLYQNVLGRAPDLAGSFYWQGMLANAATRGGVALAFAESQENIADTASTAGDDHDAEVSRLYAAGFNRAPDAAGLAYWSGLLDNGTTPLQEAAAFVGSAEFQADDGTLGAGDLVAALYQNILHRPGDPAGSAYWTGQLQAGLNQASLLLGFADSLENRVNTAAVTHANWVFTSS